jgi:hypothetical protein
VSSGSMDRDSSAASTQVRRCLRVAPLVQTLMIGSNTRHSTALHVATARRRDTLECTCCSEGVAVLRVRAPSFVSRVKTIHGAVLGGIDSSAQRASLLHLPFNGLLQPPIEPSEHPAERRKP